VPGFISRLSWVPLLAALLVLFYVARDFPRMGDPESPASTHVSPRYIEDSESKAGAPNMVTAVLADYRSYDTLGETVVILTAGLACLLVLGSFRRTRDEPEDAKLMVQGFGSDVLDATSRLLIPFIVLFAVYVVVHGHTSPGGGFQGGAIFAAGLMLVRLTRGKAKGLRLRAGVAVIIACAGIFIYLGTGLLSLIRGYQFLDYAALPLPYEGGHLREFGSLTVEVGVFIAVTAVLMLIFDVLTSGAEE